MSAGDSTVLYRRAGSAVDKREIRQFADQLRTAVCQGRSFTCLLTDDRELQRLNRMFLNNDYPTDVLSFPSQDEEQIGELAISVQRAAEQATELGHAITDEVKILMLHGVLHLLGMDHEKDRGKMAREESKWRARCGLAPVGLIERSRK